MTRKKADGGKPMSARLSWPVLVTCILASSLSFIDGSVVNVGLPAIGKSFSAGAADLQWVINAYLLPLGSLLLLGGAMGDRFGRKRLLTAGTILFAIASVICATAPTLIWLLVGRAVQGMGAAILLPNSLAVLGDAFSGEAKGRAVGIWAAAGAALGAIGPVLGGWLIDEIGWRSIFLINLAPAIGAVVMALVFIHEAPVSKKAPGLDLLGGLLASASLGAVTWSLTTGTGGDGWTPAALIAMVAGIILSLIFLLVERRRGARAMMPLAMFGSKTFVGLSLLTLLLYGALGALMVLVPYVLIEAAHYSGMAAGAALLPFALLLSLASPLIGGLAEKTGPRLPLTLGPLVVAAGFLCLLRLSQQANYWTEVFPGVLILAAGMSIAVAPLTTAVLSSVDRAHTGSASGFNSAVARSGGLIATALLGGILGTSGSTLIAGFRMATGICALVCVGAAACAFLLIARREVRSSPTANR